MPCGPRARSAATLHLGKRRPFTTAPFGKRSNVRVSWSGAGAAGSVIVNLVRRLSPPRSLLRSRLEYLAVNSTCSVVTAPAGAGGREDGGRQQRRSRSINLQRLPMRLLSPLPGRAVMPRPAPILSPCASAGSRCRPPWSLPWLVAEAAVWLLRPDGVIDPLPVSEASVLHAPPSSTAPTISATCSA